MELNNILIDKLLANISKQECWIWKSRPNSTGYGDIYYSGKRYLAHRLSWIYHKGKIPEGLLVCHKCDVRNCINPDHLFLGTHADNNKDRALKGRSAKPIWCVPKLNIDQKNELVRKYQNGNTQCDLAKEYNIDQRLVWQIINKSVPKETKRKRIVKLTPEIKDEIILKYKHGVSMQNLSLYFNMSKRLIWNIFNPEKVAEQIKKRKINKKLGLSR